MVQAKNKPSGVPGFGGEFSEPTWRSGRGSGPQRKKNWDQMFNPLNLQMNIEVHTGHQVKRQLSPTSTTCDCEVWKHTQRRIISFKINQLAVNLPLKLAAHWAHSDSDSTDCRIQLLSSVNSWIYSSIHIPERLQRNLGLSSQKQSTAHGSNLAFQKCFYSLSQGVSKRVSCHCNTFLAWFF